MNGFIEKLKAIDPKLVQSTNDSSFLFRDYFEIIFTQVIVGIAIVCQPHIITKSMLIKSDSGVKRFLTVAVISQIIFFFVVFTGLYARIMFPDLTFNGKPINLDSVIPTYVVQEFPVYFGILVVLGLISAGISTLEGLIQSISTTATVDIFERLFGKYLPADEVRRGKSLITVNKIMIAVFGIIAVYLSHEQLTNPKLSVGIFAQNGVYAYFSAAFVPILMGLFIKSVPKVAPIAASVTAIGVHFTMYYGKLGVPFTKATGENPGVAASMAILASVIVGFTVYYLSREKVNA